MTHHLFNFFFWFHSSKFQLKEWKKLRIFIEHCPVIACTKFNENNKSNPPVGRAADDTNKTETWVSDFGYVLISIIMSLLVRRLSTEIGWNWMHRLFQVTTLTILKLPTGKRIKQSEKKTFKQTEIHAYARLFIFEYNNQINYYIFHSFIQSAPSG